MLLISVAAALEESALRKRKELDVDEELLLKIGRGDSDALARLVQTAGKAVYAYILSIIRNPEDADDIYQDTFLKIQTTAADYKPQG